MRLLTLIPDEFAVLTAVLGLLLPFAAGAAGAIPSGKVFVGSRVGFWSGMIGSLIGFFILAASGYLQAWFSGVGVFAFMDGQGQRSQVEWIGDGNGSALLVVAAENKLTAFKISGQAR